MKGLKIHFGFGIGERLDGSVIQNRNYRIGLIKHEAARLFGGYSFTRIEGGWINGKGRLVEEPGAILEIVVTGRRYDSVLKIAKAFRETIKDVLEQEAIVLTVTECKFTEVA